jgi:hypothetical protein
MQRKISVLTTMYGARQHFGHSNHFRSGMVSDVDIEFDPESMAVSKRHMTLSTAWRIRILYRESSQTIGIPLLCLGSRLSLLAQHSQHNTAGYSLQACTEAH